MRFAGSEASVRYCLACLVEYHFDNITVPLYCQSDDCILN